MNPELGYLADHPRFIPTLAAWHHQEWSYLRPDDTLEARTKRLEDACGRAAIPTVIVAFSGPIVYGSAKLVDHDMDTRVDLSPWLAGVFVTPNQRRNGIGSLLVRRVVTEARTLGVPRLHLFTAGSERFYTRLGWSLFERTRYLGIDVNVMAQDLGEEKSAGETQRNASSR